MTLRLLLARLHAEYGSWRALGEQVGVVQQVMQTGMHRGTFSVEVLFRLSEVAGEPPGDVLRMAGKADLAALFERLYVHPPPPLSEEHRTLLAMYDQLPKPLRRTIVTLLMHLTMRR